MRRFERRKMHTERLAGKLKESDGFTIRTITAKVHLQKEISGRDLQGTWLQDELIGCIPPVVI
jgi:hypothetical protein